MVLISALAIGIAPICAKLAYLGGSNSYSLITARNLMMTTCLGLGLLGFGRSFRLPKNSLIIALAMGPIYVLLSFGYLDAVAYIPVDLAILIYFLHPLFIGILVRVIGQETVSRIRHFALCLALLGLTIAIGATAAGLSATGIGLALMSAIACAIMIVGNAAAMKEAESVVVIFYMVLSATIILAVAHCFFGPLELPAGVRGWSGFLGVGIAYTVGITLFFAAIPMLGATRAAMISNIEPIFGIVGAALVLGESVSIIQGSGILLVFGSIILMETSK
jgi:drug/metabolite transporter (DMT)-like permease